MEAPEDPHGPAVKVRGIARLDPDAREGVRCLIRANKAALVALLASGSPAALTVRQEASEGSASGSKEQSRGEAA